MQKIAVGERFPFVEELELSPFNDTGGYHYYGDENIDMIVIAYNGLTDKEVAAFKAAPLAFGFVTLNNVTYVTVKFSGLNTMDFPVSAALKGRSSKNNIEQLKNDETKGKPLHIIVVDTASSEFKVVVQRFISFSNKFSLALLTELEEQLKTPLTKMEFQQRNLTVQSKYSSDQLLNFSKHKYKTQ